MDIHHLQLSPLVQRALEEEQRHGDWATDICVSATAQAKARICSKENLVLACVDVIHAVFAEVDKELQVNVLQQDGTVLEQGQVIATVSGRARSLLKGERVVVELLARCCGIATVIATCVKKINGKTQLLAANSTAVSMPLLERSASIIGGACSQRLGLCDGVIVSAKHVQLAGSIKQAVALLRESLSPILKVAVEINDLAQLNEVGDAGVDLVILHNMDCAKTAFAVRTLRNRTLVAVAGDFSVDDIQAISDTGVNFIASNSLVRTAKAANLTMQISL